MESELLLSFGINFELSFTLKLASENSAHDSGDRLRTFLMSEASLPLSPSSFKRNILVSTPLLPPFPSGPRFLDFQIVGLDWKTLSCSALGIAESHDCSTVVIGIPSVLPDKLLLDGGACNMRQRWEKRDGVFVLPLSPGVKRTVLSR